ACGFPARSAAHADLQALSRRVRAAVPLCASGYRKGGDGMTGAIIDQLDGLEAHLAAADVRLARLASHEAIERLQRAYGYFTDKGLWAAAADLFADTGTWEWGQSGVYRGRERIAAALAHRAPDMACA